MTMTQGHRRNYTTLTDATHIRYRRGARLGFTNAGVPEPGNKGVVQFRV